MRLRLIGGAVLMAFALSSCAATLDKLVGVTVNQKAAAATVTSINAAETLAAGYLNLPTCVAAQTPLKNACKSSGSIQPVIKAAKATMQAKAALMTALGAAQVQGTNVGVASTVYLAATASLTTLTSTVSAAKAGN